MGEYRGLIANFLGAIPLSYNEYNLQTNIPMGSEVTHNSISMHKQYLPDHILAVHQNIYGQLILIGFLSV